MQQKLYLITQIFQGFISQVALQFFKIFGKKLGIIFKNINLTLESLGKQVEKILLWHIQVQISMLL
jgi:hypothetical protein